MASVRLHCVNYDTNNGICKVTGGIYGVHDSPRSSTEGALVLGG